MGAGRVGTGTCRGGMDIGEERRVRKWQMSGKNGVETRRKEGGDMKRRLEKRGMREWEPRKWVKNGKWCEGSWEREGWQLEEEAKEEGDKGAGTG